MQKQILAAIGIALLLTGAASAQTQGTLVVKDGNGTTQNLCQVSSAAGSLQIPCSNIYVQGAEAGVGNPLPVVGADSGPITATATPANSSHAAGTSVGGLFTIPLARVNGGSGALTQFAFTSTGASVGQYVVRIWDKQPTSTTCTDNTAFAGNYATDDANLITPFFTIAPIAVTVTTGDTATYASLTNLNWDYKNADGTASQNLYVCITTVLTDTADDNHAVRVMLSGPQN